MNEKMFTKSCNNANNTLPTIIVSDTKEILSKKDFFGNLWSKIENDELSSSWLETTTSKLKPKTFGLSSISRTPRNNKFTKSPQFTGLPFHKTIDDMTQIKMVDVANTTVKKNRYVVAPDGYIPNSKVRENYPPIFSANPPKKKKLKGKMDEEAEFIKKILFKHLAPDKIRDVRVRTTNRKMAAIKKIHYDSLPNDILAIQNEVMDNFNMELEMTISESKSERIIKPIKKKKLQPINLILAKPKSRVSKIISIQDELSHKVQSSILDLDFIEEVSEDDIDIDILDKLDKQIEEGEKLGILSNEKIKERIQKDRQYRMDDAELKKCLEFLKTIYGSDKEMYKDITKALNRNTESLKTLEKHLQTRQKRLEFLNTLTDPQHLFNYLCEFYENRSELLDTIQNVLIGIDNLNLKQLTLFVGESYKLREFFAEFVAVKKYAKSVLSAKITSDKDCMLALEKSLRSGIIGENIVFSIFMSSENDAKRFFECVPECRLTEMSDIIKHMIEIQSIQQQMAEKLTKTSSMSSITTELKNIDIPVVVRKEIHIEKTPNIILPPLPQYNEDSWKIMMSQYIAQMLTNIVPEGPQSPEIIKAYVEDANLLALIKELSFLHVEVLRLLKVYLNNDVGSAKKLLDGLISQDDLAYQALIELIGEREAMQIIKSLRLKQAKVIEKIIENHKDEQHMTDAKELLRSMTHYLPESLSKNLNTWLNAGQVSAKDIHSAVTELAGENLSSEEPEVEEDLIIGDDYASFVSKSMDRRSRQSITNFSLSKDDEAETTKGPLRRKSIMYGTLEVDYRDLPDRETEAEGVITFLDEHSTGEDLETLSILKSHRVFSERDSHVYKPIITTDEEKIKEAENKMVIEYNICQEICNIPWLKSESVTNYDEIVIKLMDMISATDSLEETSKMTAAMMNVAERSSNKDLNLLIADNLFGQVINLLEDDEKVQQMWVNILSQEFLHEDFGEKEIIDSGIIDTDMKEGVIREIKISSQTKPKIQIDKVLRYDQDKNLEDAIRSSYNKHKKIIKLIDLLKKFELSKALELEAVIKNKVYTCPLFVPEFNEHISTVRNLGMSFFEPHELVNINPNVIMRKIHEELKRTAIKSNRVEELNQWVSKQPNDSEIFWEKAAKSPYIKSKHSKRENINIVSKDQDSVDTYDLLSLDAQESMTISPVAKWLAEDVVQTIDHSLKSPLFKRLSDTSVMNFRNALTIKQLRLPGDVLKGEYVEEEVIKKDEGSLDDETHMAYLIPKKVLPKRKPKDPYYDFHTLYGANAYYLPYINPELERKGRSREDSFPKYNSSKDKHENAIFENVNKMINGFGRSNTKATPTFTGSRFLRRPSGVPLKDWIKLGAPGMATNMVISDKIYKTSNSKCRFHHLTKLRLHDFGISATKHLERCDLVEFISKANANSKLEKIKSKLQEVPRKVSTKSLSSASLLTSF